MLLRPLTRPVSTFGRSLAFTLFLFSALAVCSEQTAHAQDTPLISGGVAFQTNTIGGNTTYVPIIAPVLEAPIGKTFLIESRATLAEIAFPRPGSGYDSTHFTGLDYLQLDILATKHLTVVAGKFLTPFGTYNERLTPLWISNFQDAPLIYSVGTFTSAGVGGMVRGSAISTSTYSISYAAYFSTHSSNTYFQSSRSTGGQLSIFFPKHRVELGTSYGRLLEAAHSNNYGIHVWYEPPSLPLKVRSEYAHSTHSQGYWIESDYRLSRFGGEESLLGRLEPIFRWQQTFRGLADPTDGLPPADTKRTDFGLDYHLPHEIRINTSYARQFSPAGNFNVWETALVYRFLFPAWPGKQ